MNNSKRKNHFFDKRYFNFLIKEIAKKHLIYIFTMIYFLLILSYSIIVPVIANTTAYEIYSFSITILFLVFSCGIVAIILSIEIFKSSIDDGTELLILSKPFTRKEICVIKISVFFIYTLIISLVASLLSSFSFLTNPGLGVDYLYVSIGVFTGSIIVSFLFGGITAIITIFCSKNKAFIISVFILASLLLYSILSAFATKSYILELDDKKSMPIKKVAFINVQKDKKSSQFIQGYYLNESNRKEYEINDSIESINIINDTRQFYSNYNLIYYTDVVSQLSQIFTLGQTTNDLFKIFDILKIFNSPFMLDTSFNDVNKFFENPIELIVGPVEKFLTNVNDQELINAINDFNSISYLLPQFRFSSQVIESSFDVTLDKYSEYTEKKSISSGDAVITQYDSTIYDNLWKKYKLDIQSKIKSAELGPYDIAEYFMSLIIDDYNLNQKNVKEFISYLSTVIKSSLYKLTYGFKEKINLFNIIDVYNDIYQVDNQGNITWDSEMRVRNLFGNISDENNKLSKFFKEQLSKIDPNVTERTKLSSILEKIKHNHKEIYDWIQEQQKDRLEILTLFGMLGVRFQTIFSVNNQNNNQFWKNQLPFITYDSIYVYRNKLEGTDNTVLSYNQVRIEPHVVLRTNYDFESFTNVKIKSVYNQIAVCLSWSFISILTFIISMAIYSKKDFR